MKRTKLFIVAILSLVLSSLIVGCASVAKASNPSHDVNLDGTSWTLYQLGQDVIDGNAATLIFAGGQVQGNATCNRFFGSYEQDGAKLSFGMLGTTMMACIDMNSETEYLAALATVTAWRLDGERLVLADDQNDLLVFEPTQPTPFEGTTWQLTGLHIGTGFSSVLTDTQITATFGDDQVTGSAGCNRYFGSATSNDGQLAVGMVGSTEMFCGQPQGVMEQELAYLEALQSAVTFQIEDNVLTLFSKEGQRALRFVATED